MMDTYFAQRKIFCFNVSQILVSVIALMNAEIAAWRHNEESMSRDNKTLQENVFGMCAVMRFCFTAIPRPIACFR